MAQPEVFGESGKHQGRRGAKIVAVFAAIAVAATGFMVSSAPSVSAWPAPTIVHPPTVTADRLPTVQINGVVWAQALVGDTVYVGGSFTEARPAGSPAGTNTVTRSNMLAFNVVTGELISSFAPNPNAQVRTITVSPDGSRIYVGGDFTSIAGTSRSRIAAFSTANNQLVSDFAPNMGYHVFDIAAFGDTVYVGGNFLNVGSTYRGRLAAFSATNGALLSWAPDAPDREVRTIEVSPDGSQVAIGGHFEILNGDSTFGRGFAVLDAVSGQVVPFAATEIVRNGGADGAIMSFDSDDGLLYITGYTFGRAAGTLEGVVAARWGDGAVESVNDCHGDTHSVHAQGDVVYSAGHAHMCANIDGFDQPPGEWDWYRGVAHTKEVAGTVRTERLGYTNFEGQPRPDLLNWFPALSAGSYTGLSQGPWHVTGDDRYIVMGGEFVTVNGTLQQGLVRFTVPDDAPNDQGPFLFNETYPVKVRSFEPGTATISWNGNRDRDDATLRYRVFRRTGGTGNGELVHTRSVTAPFWNLPVMTYTDDTATGSGYEYRVQVDDGDNNFANSFWTTVEQATPASDYVKAVLESEPDSFWRLGESTGSTVATDLVGWRDAAIPATGVTLGQPGAIGGDTDTAASFAGTSNDHFVRTTTPENLSHVLSLEAWIRTASNANGGLIVGFNSRINGDGSSSAHDRALYMDTGGRLRFALNPTTPVAIGSAQDYRDGEWHHVVGTLGLDGMTLYVDGVPVAQDTSITSARTGYYGYARIGGGALNGFPDTNTNTGRRFDGLIDDVAYYKKVLTPDRVAAHFVAAGGDVVNVAPVASFTATPDGLSVDVDASLSSDADGTVTGWAWDFGDGNTSAVGPVTDHTYGAAGTYTVTLTVTDDDGATSNVASQEVTVDDPNVAPVASFTATPDGLSVDVDASFSSDSDGTVTGWAWDFGDGNTSAVGPVTDHTYAAAGTYTVTLTVTDDDGATSNVASQEVTVTAPNVPPVAEFEASPNGLSVVFNGALSSDADGTVTGWAWNFGDGNTSDVGPGTDHTYAAAGTYTVTLTVTDDGGATSDVASQEVTVEEPVDPNVAPVASFTATPDGLSVGVDASLSSDADGTVTGWAWNFGDGNTSDVGPVTDHTYGAAGTYTVTLTVTDDGGATSNVASQEVTVTAPNVAPVASFTATPDGLSVGVDASLSSDADGTVTGWAWDFGDGNTSDVGPVTDHTYGAAGTYTVTLTVTDDDGATSNVASQEVTVTAPNVAPVASFTATPDGLSVGVDASLSSDADGTVTGWAWNFGDGNTSDVGPVTDHTYGAAGTYTVTLTVTDDGGATSNVASQEVTVTAPNVAPVASFTATPDGLSVGVDASLSSDADGTVTGWAWNFGDGNTSDVGPVTDHTYGAAGTYTVTLTVTDDDGATSNVASQEVTVTLSAPLAVVLVSATPGAGSVSLDWDAPVSDGGSPVTSYSVYRSESGSGFWSYATGTGPGATEASVVGLTAGVSYDFRVYARNAIGFAPPSNILSATPDAGVALLPPLAVVLVSATPGAGSVSVDWDAPVSDGGSPVTSYSVYRSESGSGFWSYATGTGPGATEASVVGLTAGVSYDFRVYARNAIGFAPPSNVIAATPTGGVVLLPPLAVVLVSATPGAGSVSLDWDAPVSDGGSPVTSYSVYRSESGSGFWSYATGTGPGATEASVVGLTAGVSYDFRVYARNAIGFAPPSNILSATPDAGVALPPLAVVLVSATPGAGSVSLDWDAPVSDGGSPVTSYSVYRSESGSGFWSYATGTGPGATEASVVGLTAGTSYDFKVYAKNAIGFAPPSNVLAATPL